jgi:ABC-type transport system substrate-binding protein
MRAGITQFAIGVFAALSMSVAATASMAEPSGVLRVAVGADPETFDPHFNDLPTGNTVDKLVLQGLFRLDTENNVVPELAKEWSFSDDGMTFTVTLHEGHTFSNGDPVDAAAVAASFNRLLDPAVGAIYRGLYSSIGEAVAVDDATVEFRMASPNGHILLLLASTTATIVNVDAIDQMGAAEYSRRPVGSGPYLVDSFVGGERYRLAPNPRYTGDYPATLEAIEFLVVPEDGSRMALLETGDVHIVERVPPESIATIDALPGAGVILPPSMFSINMELVLKGPLEDPRVRQALNLAIDREGMVHGILGGLGTPSVGMVGPGTQDELRRTYEPIPHDPQRAAELIAEAGYAPREIALTMTCPTGRYIKDVQVCQAIQAQFQAIGVNATANIVDRGTWSSVAATPPAERTDHMALLGRATAGIDFTLYRLFRSGVSANTTGFSNPEVDDLLQQGRATTDIDAQREIYGKVQDIVWETQPFVFLWYQKQALGVADAVQGFEVQPNETMNFDQVRLTQ